MEKKQFFPKKTLEGWNNYFPPDRFWFLIFLSFRKAYKNSFRVICTKLYPKYFIIRLVERRELCKIKKNSQGNKISSMLLLLEEKLFSSIVFHRCSNLLKIGKTIWAFLELAPDKGSWMENGAPYEVDHGDQFIKVVWDAIADKFYFDGNSVQSISEVPIF